MMLAKFDSKTHVKTSPKHIGVLKLTSPRLVPSKPPALPILYPDSIDVSEVDARDLPTPDAWV